MHIKMAAGKIELEPPDRARCQTDIYTPHGPFSLGPRPKPSRCSNKPIVIATEKVAGDDGLTGSMSLCGPCKDEFEKQMGSDFATYEHIVEKASDAG